jgi:hypothetical protein
MGAANGTRNHTLNEAAFSLGQLVAGGELQEGDVIAELTAAARLAGLGDNEIGATIRSGLSAGARSPETAAGPLRQCVLSAGSEAQMRPLRPLRP